MTVKFVTMPDKRLAASILESASSFQVSNILGWDGEAVTASDFGTQAYVAFRNSTNTLLEIMEIDPATIASTSITIVRRGLQFDGDLTTEVSANKRLWVKGDTIVSFGTHPPQLFQYLKDYIDDVAISGSPNASTTAKGIVEEATQAELRARTGAGATSARLFVNPETMPNVLISDYVADTGSADAYAIAPTPAITAYVTGQIFTFKATNANTIIAPTLAVNGLAAKTITKRGGQALDAGDIGASQIIAVEYDGTNFQLISPVATKPGRARFGGTGEDGALAISSGTTTIDCANAKVVIKNYTSIAITGTAKLAFSNPHATGTIVILKSQGNVTLTSSDAKMIDLVGMGAAGGTGGPAANAGSNGSDGAGMWSGTLDHGDGCATGASSGTAGAAPTAAEIDPWTTGSGNTYKIYRKAIYLLPGSGGGGGAGGQTGGSQSDGGAGGRGGGALYIECDGFLNFTTGSIDVSGAVGTDGVDLTGDGASSAGAGGAGGGGSAGMALILYNFLTANTGTIVAKGGVGGTGGDVTNGGNATSARGGGGGGGAAGYGGAGGAGGASVSTASNTVNGTVGSNTTSVGAGSGGGAGAAVDTAAGAATGGAGGTVGDSVTCLVLKNTEFA